jgi:hypothetical protein
MGQMATLKVYHTSHPKDMQKLKNLPGRILNVHFENSKEYFKFWFSQAVFLLLLRCRTLCDVA